MARVDVARALGRRQHGVRPWLVGGDAHGSAERGNGNVDVLAELCRGSIAELEVADIWVGKIGSQEAEARQQRSPAPGPGFQSKDLNLEHVAGLGVLHKNRTAEGIQL